MVQTASESSFPNLPNVPNPPVIHASRSIYRISANRPTVSWNPEAIIPQGMFRRFNPVRTSKVSRKTRIANLLNQTRFVIAKFADY
jgi:hypothetical protein